MESSCQLPPRSGGKVTAIQGRDSQTGVWWGRYESTRKNTLVSEALRFAAADSRYAYQMGFYVPESELDGKVHMLGVTVPGNPKLGLRYRSGYTASANATAPDAAEEPSSLVNSNEVGIDAKLDVVKNEARVLLTLSPETVTREADGAIVLGVTFTQTDGSGKQLAKLEETVGVPSLEYTRAVKVNNSAVLLHVNIRDQATDRAGSIAIPIGKQ